MAKKLDFTPLTLLVAMTAILVVLKWLQANPNGIKGLMTSIDSLIGQLFATTPSAPAPPSTTPAPTPPAGTPAPTPAPTSCDCTCMPMDGDPERRKIETAAGEDCVNHEYFGPENADALCAAKLAEVCATRGGGGGGGIEKAPGTEGESGGAKAPTGDDEDEEDEDEENANIARIFKVSNA